MMFQIGLVEDSDLDEIAGIDAVAMADNGAARAVEKAIPGSGPRRDIFLMWIRKTFKQDEAHAFWKVVDAETGEIVSAAKWSYYYEPKAPECRRREEGSNKGRDAQSNAAGYRCHSRSLAELGDLQERARRRDALCQ